jgi:urea transport system substrate-binding protein
MDCRSLLEIRKIRAYLAIFPLLLSACSDQTESLTPPLFQGEIKVGILHSQSGTMAFSEGTAAEGEVLAIEEINDRGGILLGGKRLKIVPVVADGASDPRQFAASARKLIDEDHVNAIFGGWTSASRKAMLPVIEQRNHLLFYPIQYEGQECSSQVFYGGATPNQQIEPALEWLLSHKGQTFFLVGSDYVYPRTANRIVRALLSARGASIVGEEYIPLGSNGIEPLIESIRKQLPQGGIIVNTLNGDSNSAFFKALKNAYLTPANGYITMSFSIAEEEVSEIGADNMLGSFASRNFFQTLDTQDSRRFTKAFRFRYGQKRVTSDPTASGYTLVHLWAQGVEKAGSLETEAVRNALIGISFDAPEGRVVMQPNHHLKRPTLIGEVRKDGLFEIVDKIRPIDPLVFNRYIPEDDLDACHALEIKDRPTTDPHALHPR